ncbi:hypothetical protein ACLOJK_033800 [Asimina triloba]
METKLSRELNEMVEPELKIGRLKLSPGPKKRMSGLEPELAGAERDDRVGYWNCSLNDVMIRWLKRVGWG